MSEVVDHARAVNDWMKGGGRAALAAKLGVAEREAGADQ